MLCYVLCYAMLCYAMLCYAMSCYVHCVDCQFYGGASGTRRATARQQWRATKHGTQRRHTDYSDKLTGRDKRTWRWGRRNMRTAAKAGPRKYPPGGGKRSGEGDAHGGEGRREGGGERAGGQPGILGLSLGSSQL